MARRSRRNLLLVALLLVAPALAARDAARSAAEIAYREVDALLDVRNTRDATPKIDAALKRFHDEGSPWVWGMRVQRARVMIYSGDTEAAFLLLSAAPPHGAARSHAAARRLISLAWLYGLRNVPEQARTTIHEASQLASSYQPGLRAEVLKTRALLEWKGGDLDAAVKSVRQAVRLARAGGQRATEVSALVNLAYFLGLQERYDEAVSYNEQILPNAAKLGLDAFVLKAQMNLAWQYLELGQYDRAADRAAEAYALAVRQEAKTDVLTILLLQGNAHYYRGEFAEASVFYRQAYDIGLRTGNPDVGKAAANLSVIALETGDFAAARRYNNEATQWKHKTQDKEAALHSLLIDGRIALATQQLAEAERLLKRVIAETASKAFRFEARTRLAEVYARSGRAALAESEFRGALDAAAEARADISSEELRMTFASTVSYLYDAYIEFFVTSGRKLEALRITEQSRARTLTEGLGFTLDRAAAVDPQKIARDRGAVVLAYWLAPERSFLWVVTADEIKLFPLPAAKQIEADVEAYSRELLGPGSMLSARGAKLWRTLVGPAAPSLPPDARIILVPDGRLNAFNFETLVTGAHPHYWIEDVTIETAASLQLAARGSRARATDGKMLLVGDPHVPSAEFPPLAHAASEMERVRKHFATTTQLNGDAATPDAYEKSAGGDYAFIHFVAHGTASMKRPLDSAVILSPGADGYKLYARDIIKHPLTARLVTISSCHGAGTRAYAGEGLVGLAWAFLRAGAHEVIAALWQVSDRATPQLMDRMYQSIRAGRDPASALRDAKLQLIRSNTINKRPLYWAPFVLYSGS